MLIERDRSCLLLIDVQERLLASMDNAARLVSNCAVLLKAAARLGVPVLASEQYPKGLGPTVPELAALVPEGAPVTKTEFSCAAAPGYLDRLRETGRDQLVLAGIEAHVCVLQTALQLRDLGYKMFVVDECVFDRSEFLHNTYLFNMNAKYADVLSLSDAEAYLASLPEPAHPPRRG